MGFEPTTIRLEVRCSTVKAISPFGPNKVGTVFDLTSLHYFCEVFYVVIGGGWTGYVMRRYYNFRKQTDAKRRPKGRLFLIGSGTRTRETQSVWSLIRRLPSPTRPSLHCMGDDHYWLSERWCPWKKVTIMHSCWRFYQPTSMRQDFNFTEPFPFLRSIQKAFFL